MVYQSTHAAVANFDIGEDAVGAGVEDGGADALGLERPLMVSMRTLSCEAPWVSFRGQDATGATSWS